MTIMDEAFEAMFFGEPGWVMGLLIFFALSIALLLKWKYSGVFLIPIIVGLESLYYDRLQTTPNTYRYAWPMAILLIFVVFVVYHMITGKEKG